MTCCRCRARSDVGFSAFPTCPINWTVPQGSSNVRSVKGSLLEMLNYWCVYFFFLLPLQARMTGTAPSGQLQGRPLPPLEAARRLTGSTHIDSTEADSPPLVSPWQAPVYHGSSRFKKPDKSNCLFCLWFGLFLRRTLYKRANWELKIGTGFWDLTANSLPHPFFVAPTNHPTNQSGF